MPKVETSHTFRGKSLSYLTPQAQNYVSKIIGTNRFKRELLNPKRRIVKKLIRIEPIYNQTVDNTNNTNYFHPNDYLNLNLNLNKHVDKSEEYLGLPSNIPKNFHRKRVIVKKKRKPIIPEYEPQNSNQRKRIVITKKRKLLPKTTESEENLISQEEIKPTRRVRLKKIKHTLNPISESFDITTEKINVTTSEPEKKLFSSSEEETTLSNEETTTTHSKDILNEVSTEIFNEEDEETEEEDDSETLNKDDEHKSNLPDYEPFFPELSESLDAPILLLKTTVLSTIESITKTTVQSKLRTYTFVVTRVNGDEMYVTSTTEVKPHTKTVTVIEPTTKYTTLTLLDLDATDTLPFKPMTVFPSMESSNQPQEEKGRALDEARYNLATRVMSNGVEVIVAGDKSTLPGEPDIKRVLPSSIYKPVTLKPSTLTNNMMMMLPQEASKVESLSASLYPKVEFVTKTCLTTFTYLTTYLENGTTTVSSHEQVVSNIATEERNTGKILPTPTMGITLTQYPNLAIGTFLTTYTYLNTILDGEQPLVVTSKRVVTNTVTAPDDYLSLFQPNEKASAIKDTNTYFSTLALKKTLYEGDISQVISTNEVVTQVVITESIPPKGTSVMTSYIALDFDNDTNAEEYSTTDVVKTYFVTYTYHNTVVDGENTMVHTNISTSSDVVTEKLYLNPKKTKGGSKNVINTAPILKDGKKKIKLDIENLSIYATKTYLTTFTYFTTLLQENKGSTSTIISSHSRIVENVVTETIEPSLLDKKYLNSLKKEIKDKGSTITKLATLNDGQKLEITAISKEKIKPTKVLSIEKTQMPEIIETTPRIESSNPNIVTGSTIIFVDEFDDPFAAAVTKVTPSLNKISKTQSKNALNSLLSSEIVKKPQQHTASKRKTGPKRKSSITPSRIIEEPSTKIDKKPSNKIAKPTNPVSNILGSINIQALTPVLNAMAGLIQTNLKSNRRNDSNTTTVKPIEPVDVQNRSPIYIPVGGLADIETAESQNIANSWNEDKVPLTKPSHESPLLNGGIPISPGEVITANSDVIVGKIGKIGPRIPAIPLNHPDEIPVGMKPPPIPNKSWPKRHSEHNTVIHSPNKDDYIGPPPPKIPVRPQNAIRGDKHKNNIDHRHIPLNPYNLKEQVSPPKDFYYEKQDREKFQEEIITPTRSNFDLKSSILNEPIVLPEVIERSTGQPLLVNIQPSQVAFVNIPHNRTTALIYGGSTEHHINGQYFDDPSPYPQPEFSAIESFNHGVPKFASIYNDEPNHKEVRGVIKVGTQGININPPGIPIGVDIKPSRPSNLINGIHVDSHVNHHDIKVHVPPISFGMVQQGNDFNAHIINHDNLHKTPPYPFYNDKNVETPNQQFGKNQFPDFNEVVNGGSFHSKPIEFNLGELSPERPPSVDFKSETPTQKPSSSIPIVTYNIGTENLDVQGGHFNNNPIIPNDQTGFVQNEQANSKDEFSGIIRHEQSGNIRNEQPGIIRNKNPAFIRNGQPNNIRNEQPAFIRNEHPSFTRNEQSGFIRNQQSSFIRNEQPSFIRNEQTGFVRNDQPGIIRNEQSEFAQTEQSNNVRNDVPGNIRNEQLGNIHNGHGFIRTEQPSHIRNEHLGYIQNEQNIQQHGGFINNLRNHETINTGDSLKAPPISDDLVTNLRPPGRPTRPYMRPKYPKRPIQRRPESKPGISNYMTPPPIQFQNYPAYQEPPKNIHIPISETFEIKKPQQIPEQNLEEIGDHKEDDLENEAGEVIQESNSRPLIPGQLPIEILQANSTTITTTTTKPSVYNYIPHENEILSYKPHIKQPRPFDNPVVRPENQQNNQINHQESNVIIQSGSPNMYANVFEYSIPTTTNIPPPQIHHQPKRTSRPKITSLPIDTKRLTTYTPNVNEGSQTEEPFKNYNKTQINVFNFESKDIPRRRPSTTRRTRPTTGTTTTTTTTHNPKLQLNIGEIQNINMNFNNITAKPLDIEMMHPPPPTVTIPVKVPDLTLNPPKVEIVRGNYDNVMGMTPPPAVITTGVTIKPIYSMEIDVPKSTTKSETFIFELPPTTPRPRRPIHRRPSNRRTTTSTTQATTKYFWTQKAEGSTTQSIITTENIVNKLKPTRQRRPTRPPTTQENKTNLTLPEITSASTNKPPLDYSVIHRIHYSTTTKRPSTKHPIDYNLYHQINRNRPRPSIDSTISSSTPETTPKPIHKYTEIHRKPSKEDLSMENKTEGILEKSTETTLLDLLSNTDLESEESGFPEKESGEIIVEKPTEYSVLPTGTVETVELEITPTRIYNPSKIHHLGNDSTTTHRRRVVTAVFKRPINKESKVILPTRYITHTKTSTVTITKTTVVKSLGAPPSTMTILVTKTEKSTIVDTVTEFHTLVKPTTIAETITISHGSSLYPSEINYDSYPIKPTQVHSSEIEPTILIEGTSDELEDFIIHDTDPPIEEEPPEEEHDNNSFFVVMTDKNQGSVIKIPKQKEDSRETQHRDEMINNNEVNRVLLGGIVIASPPSLETNVVSDKCVPECKASKNELCQKVDGLMRCLCRPGFARMFPDRPCKPTYTYTMKIALERNGKERLRYEDALSDMSTPEFTKLASSTHEALDRMVMQSDLRDIYHGVHVQGYEPIEDLDGVYNTFNLQLSDNTDETRLKEVFKKYLRNNNYSLGGTEIYASKEVLDRLEADDFNECSDLQFHDCSEFAQCFNLRGTYTCSCKEGFADLSENILYPGRICSAELVGCEKCHYHGTCYTRDEDQIICECFQWYAGENCQVNLKVLLIALVTLGAILFTLLLICIIVTCAKRKPKSHTNNAMSFLPQRVPPNRRGGTLDRRAMIQDTSSESGQSDTNTLPYVAPKPKKMPKKGALKKPTTNLNVENVEHTLTYSDQKDRSLTVMIPRAKYHPAPPTSPHNLSSFEKRKNSAASSNEAKLLSYLDAGPSPNKIDQRKYSKTSDNFREPPGSRKTSGALVSAGFEVSATVGPTNMGTLGTIVTTCGTEADRSENATLIQKISADLLSSTGTQSQFNTLRQSIAGTEAEAMENWLDITPRIQTISESRSYDETTIQPPTKSYANDYDSKSSHHHQDEANTMAERDLGSTFLLPHTHLYKPDRGSDISGFESL